MNWESTFEVIVSQRFAPSVPEHANVRKKNVSIHNNLISNIFFNNVNLVYEKINETTSFLNFTLQESTSNIIEFQMVFCELN